MHYDHFVTTGGMFSVFEREEPLSDPALLLIEVNLALE